MTNISPLQAIIKGVLHDKAIIDSGISDLIAAKIDPIIGDLIDNKATQLSVNAQCLEGILANPILCGDMNREEITRLAMSYADELFKQLKKKEMN